MEKSKEIYLFHQGTYYHSYNLLGCHPEKGGAWFRCWAPNAKEISVVGDFNGWDSSKNPMRKIENSGIWEVYVISVEEYQNYKYLIKTADDKMIYKSDPYAFHNETNGATASKVYDLKDYEWTDKRYYEVMAMANHYEKPMNVYEVNFNSWKKHLDGSYYTYRELADELIPYVKDMGYTHIECMPITEYSYDNSWGYQVTGYFAVTSRFGTPDDFRYFVNKCHTEGIAVILDWVPGHFPKDEHGLIEWDGSYLFENHGYEKMSVNQQQVREFDYGKNEVQSFLISSAMFFIDKLHVDGLKIDDVDSMLYLDYGKNAGEWKPNENGDNKNLEAVSFLQKLNTAITTEYPHVIMIAEEHTDWPLVTKPSYIGGLGFSYKWNIGWMNDTLSYVSIDPYFRKDNHNKLTFSMFYAFSENFILPLPHEEVSFGKGSLLNKMYGEYNQKFDLMRTYLMFMFAHPGKKLSFMGNEFAQFDEWNNCKGIDFMLLDYEKHNKMFAFTKDLNNLYLSTSELYEIDYSWEGFKWLTAEDNSNNVIAFERRNKKGDVIVCIANFSPVRREHYRVGLDAGRYEEILNSNNAKYGGNGRHYGTIESYAVRVNGYENSIELTLEPNSAVYFRRHDFSVTIKSAFEIEQKQTSRSSIEAKNVVTKIIESKLSGKNIFDEKEVNQKFVPEELRIKDDPQEEIVIEETIVEQTSTEEIENKIIEQKNEVIVQQKRPKGRPRKPIDPELANRPKRPKGRPRKPIDPEEANRPKRPKGRPRKPIDPELANRPKRPKGRPRKPIDPELANRPKRPKGRPRKIINLEN